MNADTFFEVAVDASAWLRKSADLRQSGDALWDAFMRKTVEWAQQQREVGNNSDSIWNTAIAHFTSAKMLYGLALETAFKASILRNSPDSVEFKMTADGRGKIQQIELKQLGISMGSGHDLTRLADKAGLFSRGPKEVFPEDSDYITARAILDDLGDVVVWTGRYPVPVRSSEPRVPPPDVPPSAFGHHIRDWTDTVLDHYHAIPNKQ